MLRTLLSKSFGIPHRDVLVTEGLVARPAGNFVYQTFYVVPKISNCSFIRQQSIGQTSFNYVNKFFFSDGWQVGKVPLKFWLIVLLIHSLCQGFKFVFYIFRVVKLASLALNCSRFFMEEKWNTVFIQLYISLGILHIIHRKKKKWNNNNSSIGTKKDDGFW